MKNITINKLYKIWKESGVGLSAINAMRKEILKRSPEERGEFQTERDLTNLIPIFQKYHKYGESLRDLIYFWMAVISLLYFYYLIFKVFAGIFADVFSINLVFQIFISSTLLFLISMILLGFKLRQCNLRKPEKISSNKSVKIKISILSLTMLILMMAICSYLENI